jgi:alanyl-tRNA synthetase
MGDVYPELRQRAKHILETTRVEEQSFLATIEGGLTRFDQIAPPHTADGSRDLHGTISGEDAFRLYDTFGFPIDLTELMARERGYVVDIAGFETALDAQRRRSQLERKGKKLGVEADALADLSKWEIAKGTRPTDVSFVGYDTIEIATQVTAVRCLESDRIAVLLRETPFYAESGGQISDHGEIVGEDWRVDVDDVRKIDGRTVALGTLTGAFKFGPVVARVPSDERHDTERNHSATHLLHAALRQVLGDTVHQAGSLVAPDRLRFDFTHHGPVKADRLDEVEQVVNREIWRSAPVSFREMPLAEARASGAMALFGEQYGDVVRVVSIPGFSMELCGGTHVRNTAEIGLFRIVAETGVASGIRRIEAQTGPGAFKLMRDHEQSLGRVAELLRTAEDGVERRIAVLLEERRNLERRLDEALRGGRDQLKQWVSESEPLDGHGIRYVGRRVTAGDVKELQAMGDTLREQLAAGGGVGVLGTTFADGKSTLLVVVTDDLRERGVRADALVREIAAVAGGRGGGKPHMAQAGIPDASKLDDAIRSAPAIIRPLLGRL